MIALFFDTETNGIKTAADPNFKLRCVQLGAILQDTETKRVLAEINLIANQNGASIPPEASAIHGITDDIAAKFGVHLVGIDHLFAALIAKADIIVAHNIDYDLDVVHDSLPYSWDVLPTDPKSRFCTMDGNMYIVKAPLSEKQKAYYTSQGKKPDAPYKRPNLMETHQFYFNSAFDGAHDAMADIRACRDIFFALIDQSHYSIEGNEVIPSPALKALMETK